MNDVLPSGWINTTLEAVAIWSSGGTPSRSMPSFYLGTIPWFKTGELGGLYITDSEEKISPEAVASSSAKIFPKGSVILAMYGATIGKTSILGIDAATNQACAAGKPDAVDSLFLYYYLVSQTKGFIDAGKGGAQPNISQGIVRNWPIWVPPAAEQIRIVEKLEELLSDLDAGVAELKAAQKKLGQYRQSLLKAAVEGALTADWRKNQKTKPAESGAQLLKRILHERRTRWEAKQLAKFKEQGKTPAKGWQSKYVEPVAPETAGLPELPEGWVWASLDMLSEIQGGIQKQPSRIPTINKYPFLRVANVARGLLKLDDVHEIELFAGELERLTLLRGDVLIVEGNGSLSEIGRCALWDGSIENVVHQNHLIRARPIVMLSEFVESWLNSLRAIEKLTKLAATTSGLYTLSVGKISKIPVPVPPMDEQVAVIAMLASALEGQRYQDEAIKGSLKQATAQRKNILKAAFSGQLVPQDPQDEPASVLLARIRAERVKQEAQPKARKGKIRKDDACVMD